MLFHIYAAGIKAFCSDLIVHPYERELAYFLSISGHQTAVKGIIANYLENNSLMLEHNANRHYVERTCLNYTYRLKKLPSGLVHAVIFPALALPRNEEVQRNNFFLFTRDHENITTLFYRFLDDLTDIPLHESWSSWLWDLFIHTDQWIIGLDTIVGSYQGYMIEFNDSRLQECISTAILNKTPEILSCMERS